MALACLWRDGHTESNRPAGRDPTYAGDSSRSPQNRNVRFQWGAGEANEKFSSTCMLQGIQ